MTSAPVKILVGVDGSPGSIAALHWSTALAENTGASVSAMTAWAYPTAMLIPVVGVAAPPPDYVVDNARFLLAQTLEAVPAAATADQRVVMGAPRVVLTEASRDHDVLVIGRTGRGQLNRMLLGSTASYCARHADCPVVVVRDSTQPAASIIVAVDGSPTSLDALLWAINLGPDHDVVAVYSHDEWELDELPLDAKVRAELSVRAEQMLAATVQSALDANGIDESRVKLEVRQGDPRTTIVEQADPDQLLVLGAQGHSGLARWALGSLADYAVQHAPGTVAIWRPRS